MATERVAEDSSVKVKTTLTLLGVHEEKICTSEDGNKIPIGM